ncbi:MAG: hypothetical protein MK108_00070 [Mariniblastus sp.]|nr:hypothetical protein [Mariniblastus sp.]
MGFFSNIKEFIRPTRVLTVYSGEVGESPQVSLGGPPEGFVPLAALTAKEHLVAATSLKNAVASASAKRANPFLNP